MRSGAPPSFEDHASNPVPGSWDQGHEKTGINAGEK